MSFEDTTRKMADEVALHAKHVQEEVLERAHRGELSAMMPLLDLAAAVEKLALCVARRFPGTPDEAP